MMIFICFSVQINYKQMKLVFVVDSTEVTDAARFHMHSAQWDYYQHFKCTHDAMMRSLQR